MQNKESLPKRVTPEGLKEQRCITDKNNAVAIALNTLAQIAEGKKQDGTFSEDPYSYEMRIRAAEILLNHVMAEKANQAWCPKCQAYCAPMEEINTEELKAKVEAQNANG